MAIKPYPSNIIIFNVDERVLDNDMKLALKRSWTHIGEILIRPHTANESPDPISFIHVTVKYGTRPYLRSGIEDSDANWTERMEQHLLSTMRKVSSNVVAFNRRQRKYGDPDLAFDFIEFELEAGSLTLEFHLDSNGCLPSSCAGVATEIRDALNTGALGEPVRVKAPSARSYQEQAAAFAEAASTAEPLDEMEEEAEGDDEAQDDLLFVEAPELAAEIEREEAEEAKKDSPFEVAPLTEEEWELEYGVNEADFAIDYRMWEVVSADGASQEFDSQTKMFVA